MARYGVNLLVNAFIITAFPLATFIVNLTGCFLIGMFYGLADRYVWFQGNLLLFLAVGICGGFTTFSTFSSENLNLFMKSQSFTAIGYTLLSVVFGILFCRFGFVLTKPAGI